MTNQARSRPDSTDGSVPDRDMAIEAQARTAPRTDLGWLPRKQRRRVVAIALIRTAVSVTVLMVIYFNIPLALVTEGPAALLLTAGLIGVAVVLAVQIRATMRAVHPGLRAVESLGVSVPLILLLFSATHYLLERLCRTATQSR